MNTANFFRSKVWEAIKAAVVAALGVLLGTSLCSIIAVYIVGCMV